MMESAVKIGIMDDTYRLSIPLSPSKLEINIFERKLKSFVFTSTGLIVDPFLVILDGSD